MMAESAGGKLDRNPYLFVVGCPRSGTTLLQRMLDSHPQLAVANDTHFIPKALKGCSTDLELTAELVQRVRAYRRFSRLGLDEAAVDRAVAHATTYSGFVSALYAALAAQHGKLLAGEKTPDYVKCIPLLHRLFPWSHFVHIIRDGRDVTLSVLEWANEGKGPGRYSLWKEEPVALCALWWAWQVESGRQGGGESQCYLEVRYEDLIATSRKVLERISDFIGLPFAPEMLAFNEGKQRSDPGLSAKSAWLPPTPGLRDWRENLKDNELALFEALAGDLLAELGYELGVAQIPEAIQRKADRCREYWTAERARRSARG